MEEELFSVDDKTKIVRALGVELVAKPQDLHVYVDGRDILKQMVYDEIRITTTINRANQAPDAPVSAASLK